MADLKCVVVTPEKAVLDEHADFVALPMYDGELGVAHNRLPLIGRLGYGELRLTRGERTERYYIDGGFVQVRNNVITVLTSKAIPAKDIKVDAARDALRAPAASTTAQAQEEHRKSQARARAQLRVAENV